MQNRNVSTDSRTYSSTLLHAKIECNCLPVLKLFSNFVHFCPKFQSFCSILHYFNIFLLFFKKIVCMPLLCWKSLQKSSNSRQKKWAHFSRSCSLKAIFQAHLNCVPELWLVFGCRQQKIKNEALFDILINITLEINMITKQMNTFSSSTFWGLSVG